MATEVVLPMLGITIEKGQIREWMKCEGDPVEKGESIFVVEADKVTTEVEAPASGVLAKILVPVGVEVPVLTVVAIIAQPGEAIEHERPVETAVERRPAASSGVIPGAVPAQVSSGQVAAMPAARHLARKLGVDLSQVTGTGPGRVIQVRDVEAASMAARLEEAPKASTLARKLAESEGILLSDVQGTGVRGRIMREDVLKAASSEKALLQAAEQVIPMDGMRKVIARRMAESKFTAPHIYFFSEIRMDLLLHFKEEVADDFEKAVGIRLSVNDLLIKAVGLTLLELPYLNARIEREEIHIWPQVNVGLAVALPHGLIVPAIADASRIGLAEISRQRSDLVERARSGRLTMDEVQRGTFTISSLAQYEVTAFTAILNPPQSGILSVPKWREQLVLDDGKVTVTRVANFGLSVDHRLVDGAVAAGFLQSLKKKLEAPAFTFLHL